MANFDTVTKVIINDISVDASTVSGSLAKEINDYIETIDDAKLVDTNAVMLDRSRVAYIIITKDVMANCQHCKKPNKEGHFNCPSCGRRHTLQSGVLSLL